MMISSESGANQIGIAVNETGLIIAINDKTYEIALEPAQSSNLGIALMRQAHDVSKSRKMETEAAEPDA